MSQAERERYVAVRRAAALKYWEGKTPEQRSEEGRARWAKIEPERRSELAKAAWGRRSADQRAKHCEATRLALARDETKAKQCAGSKRTWDTRTIDERARITAPMQAASVAALTTEQRSATGKAAKARVDPKELSRIGRARWAGTSHEDRSALAKARWVNWNKERRREITKPGRLAASLAHPTSIERAVMVILDALNIDYRPQYPIGKYVVDVFVPSRNLVVECDGGYWHRNRQEHDAKRDAFMRDKGYEVLRLPEAMIRSGDVRSAVALACVGA